jgi:hypothetical protein
VILKYRMNFREKFIIGEFSVKPFDDISADIEFGTKRTSSPLRSSVGTPPSLHRESSTTRESTQRSSLPVFAGSFDQSEKGYGDDVYEYLFQATDFCL